MIIVLDTGRSLGGAGNFGVGGWTPVPANVIDGDRVVQQVIDWVGGTGAKPAAGQYVGQTGLVNDIGDAVNLKGDTGAGLPGIDGWTALIGIEADGERRVQRVLDWFGGEGAKPSVGQYIGPSGFVALPSQGTDVRGAEGDSDPELVRDKLVALSGPNRLPVSAVDGAAEIRANASGDLILLGPNGYPVVSRINGNRAKFRLTNVSAFGTTGANVTFNQRWATSFTGKVEVRITVELGNTAAPVSIASFGVAAGRDGSEVNAKTAAGADAVWQNATFSVAQADADYLTNGKVGRGISPWFELDVPDDGAIYARILFAANVAGQVGSGARLVSDWENYLNTRYTKMRYWASHANGNFVTTNQSAMPNGTPRSEYAPIVSIEIRPANGRAGIITSDGVGDSTIMELAVGTRGNPDFKPFNSSWLAEVISRRQKAGLPWAYANHAYEGKTAEFYLGRYEDLCINNMDATGEVAVIQPFSVNGGGFNNTIIDANFVKVNNIVNLRRNAGKLSIVRTVFPVKGQSGTVLDAWARGNRLARQMDVPLLDVASLVLNQPDNTHLDQNDQYLVADYVDKYYTTMRI